jgi:hypothetical protein
MVNVVSPGRESVFYIFIILPGYRGQIQLISINSGISKEVVPFKADRPDDFSNLLRRVKILI